MDRAWSLVGFSFGRFGENGEGTFSRVSVRKEAG